MRSYLRSWRTLACGSAMALMAACSGSGGDDGDDADAGDGGQDTGGTPCSADTASATPASGAEIIITLVDFQNNIVYIRNVSGNTITFTPQSVDETNGWRLEVATSGNLVPLPNDYQIAAGAEVAIHLSSAGTDDASNIFLDLTLIARDLQWHMDAGNHGGEIGVLSTPDEGDFYTNNPDVMEAYVRWGNESNPDVGASLTHQDEAVSAGLWTAGNTAFIPDPTDDGEDPETGVAATGDVTDHTNGWEIAPADCVD